jgi:hypothetical protein
MKFEEPDSTVYTMMQLKPTIPKNTIPAETKDLSLPQIVKTNYVSDTGQGYQQ